MIAQINDLIDAKLTLLFESHEGTLPLEGFKKSSRSKLQDAKILAEMMQRKNLITACGEKERYFRLTDFGLQICEGGGWVRYLASQKKLVAGESTSFREKSWKTVIKSILSYLISSRYIF